MNYVLYVTIAILIGVPMGTLFWLVDHEYKKYHPEDTG